MRLLFLFFVFITLQTYSQEEEYRKLLNSLKLSKNDTTKCNLLISVSEYLYNLNPDTVIPLCNQVIKIVDLKISKTNYKEKYSLLKSKASALNNIGIISADKGDLDKAIVYYLESLKTHQENQYKIGISEAYNNLGIVYDNLGDTPNALTYFHNALKIQEQLGLKSEIALTLNNIGFIYSSQNEPVKALEYYNKSLKIRTDVNDIEWIPQSLNNIANIYEKYGDPKCKDEHEVCLKKGQILALNYYKDCLKIQQKNNDKKGTAYSLNNIASIYRKYGDPNVNGTIQEIKNSGEKIAINYLMESLKIHEEIKNTIGIAYVSNNMSQVLINQGDIKNALVFSTKSMTIAKELGYPEIIYRNAMTLKRIFKLKNNYVEAYKMLELEIQMRDSINNLSNQKALITQNTKYEYEKKAAADSVKIAEEKKVTTAQLKQEKTQRFALYGGILLVGLFGVFMFNRFKVTKKQNDLIQVQKAELQLQKEIVEEHQKETLDSIHYAKRIQTALIANSDFISQHIPNNFIYFNPKDIVSGDFYWATKHNDKFYLAVCDSTGHGVPGAFMSLLNMGFLSEAIKEKNIEKPNEIFNYVRERLISTISDGGQKDGMDGILICIDISLSVRAESRTITYAAANNEPILIRDNTIIELPKDKMPVGKGEKTDSFSLQSVELQSGDALYLYTDGFADQFGGPKGKKFKYKQLNELLLSVKDLPLPNQKDKLESTFINWQGNQEQVDDVLIIGIKI
jgi:serine phosphatase RsbU (regulator of sigma subunit)